LDCSAALLRFGYVPDMAIIYWMLAVRSMSLVTPIAEQAAYVAFIHLLILVRVVQLGHVLTPFSHLLETLRVAFPFFVRLSVVVLVVLTGVAGAQAVVFGVGSDADGVWGALLVQFDYFVNGQELNVRGGDYKSQQTIYMLLYFVSSLVLFLLLSQFFIAIVVNAFDEATERLHHRLDQAELPDGYKLRSTASAEWHQLFIGSTAQQSERTEIRGQLRWLVEWACFFLCGFSLPVGCGIGTYGLALQHALRFAEKAAREENALVAATGESGLVPRAIVESSFRTFNLPAGAVADLIGRFTHEENEASATSPSVSFSKRRHLALLGAIPSRRERLDSAPSGVEMRLEHMERRFDALDSMLKQSLQPFAEHQRTAGLTAGRV